MLDRPIFSYVPEPHSEFFNPADEVSEIVTSAEDFITRLQEVRGGDEASLRARFAPQREKLAYFIANVEAPYAADRIIDVLDKLDLPEANGTKAADKKSGLIPSLRRAFRKWRGDTDTDRVARRRQKFPALSKEEADWAVGQWIEGGVLQKTPVIDRLGEKLLVFH
jgi:hypothetical protein